MNGTRDDISSLSFLQMGNVYTKTKAEQKLPTKLRPFKWFFGIIPPVCVIVWNEIKAKAPVNCKPKHLLWALFFLRQYSTEHVRKSVLQADEKTIITWTWIVVKLISSLNVVTWESRFDDAVSGQTCFCSLDGVDCKIKEPQLFSPRWYSHKFKGPGLRYEIGLCIRTGLIVWKHGGYPCGEFPDLKLAREAYVWSVNDGEKTMADRGYQDNNFFIRPNAKNKRLHHIIMARHETVNKRIKQFKILKEPFHNDLSKHPTVFHAVVNLTQLMLLNGQPLFNVNTSI